MGGCLPWAEPLPGRLLGLVWLQCLSATHTHREVKGLRLHCFSAVVTHYGGHELGLNGKKGRDVVRLYIQDLSRTGCRAEDEPGGALTCSRGPDGAPGFVGWTGAIPLSKTSSFTTGHGCHRTTGLLVEALC